MKFPPKTEQQIAEEALAPDGIYPFEIAHAEEKTSKAGNPMIEIDLLVYVGNGRREMTDYLTEKMAFKLRHFCAFTGLIESYNAGTLNGDDCIGKQGFVRIGHEAGKPKNDGSGDNYSPKNTIKDYVENPASKKVQAGPTDEQLKNLSPKSLDEDLPF